MPPVVYNPTHQAILDDRRDDVEVKVAHALFRYTTRTGATALARRGDVVTVPAVEHDRGSALDAFVKVDEPLAQPVGSTMVPLSEASTDEELASWTYAATGAEVAQAIADHPELAERLLDAVQRTATSGSPTPPVIPFIPQPAGPQPAGQHPIEAAHAAATAGQELKPGDLGFGALDGLPENLSRPASPSGVSERRSAGDVVTGTVGEVQAYLQAFPDEAALIVDAEATLADTQNRPPRKGILEQARVAASVASS